MKKRKRQIKFILAMLLYCAFSFSQSNQSSGKFDLTIDSLKTVLKNAKHDTTRCNILNELVETSSEEEWPLYNDQLLKLAERCLTSAASINLKNFYLNHLAAAQNNIGVLANQQGDIPKALKYFNESLKIKEEINDKKGIASLLNNMGLIYKSQGDNRTALEHYNKSLKIQEEIKDKKGIARALNSIGQIYNSQSNIPKALEYYHKSLKIHEEIKYKLGTAYSLNNLAQIYNDQGDIPKALDYYHKSLKIHEEVKDKNGIATALNNLGQIYSNQGNVPRALEYFQKCLKICDEIKFKKGIAGSLGNIGLVYYKQGNFDKVLEYNHKCLKIYEEINDKDGIANTLNNTASVMLKQGRAGEALGFAVRSLQTAKELGYPYSIRNAATTLKNIYTKQSNFNDALAMYELEIKMRDSISNEDNRKASYKSKLQYEYGKKALADSIKSIDEKKISSAKLAESQAKLKKERTQKIALYAGLFLILIFTGFIYNRFKNSQRQKQLIEKQKLVVDESQRKIIASINYAKKIQTSMLPSQEEMTVSFKENFVFFKPKDIVSGDFYWFHNADNCSSIAVADCTGHGVPGAFMTMIAHSILNEVVIEQKITAPDLILNNLHSLIFKALKQHKGDEYSQDGMDLSFVKIDHKNKLLTFAGARNNGFLINNSEIEILKATSKSIGGLSLLGEAEPERKFKSETFQIKENSTLILTTDGIFDQLNDEDKKFGTNRFKEMILKLKANNTSDNIPFLETTFNEWKKTVPQLDDVLLVGLKL